MVSRRQDEQVEVVGEWDKPKVKRPPLPPPKSQEEIRTDLVLHLMANGWSYDTSTEIFIKGEGRIAKERLIELLDWPNLLPFCQKAIEKGALGWKVHTQKRPNGIRVDVDWLWPDAVTRLGEIA